MIESSDKKEGIKLEDLCFYFDSQERDRVDVGRFSKKIGQFLSIRKKIMSIPDPEFDAAMQTIDKVVTSLTKQNDQPSSVDNRRDIQHLFEKVTAKASTAVNQVSKV